MEEPRLEGTLKDHLVQPDGWLCSEVSKNRKRGTICFNEIGPAFISVGSHQEPSGFHLAKDLLGKSTLNPLKSSFEFKGVINFFLFFVFVGVTEGSYFSNFQSNMKFERKYSSCLAGILLAIALFWLF